MSFKIFAPLILNTPYRVWEAPRRGPPSLQKNRIPKYVAQEFREIV